MKEIPPTSTVSRTWWRPILFTYLSSTFAFCTGSRCTGKWIFCNLCCSWS